MSIIQSAFHGPDLRALLEGLPDPFVALDHEWRVTFANLPALRFAGLTETQAVGHSLWALFPAIVGTPIEAYAHHAMRHRAAVEFEAYFPPRRAWLAIRAYPQDDGLAVHFRDITLSHQDAVYAHARSALTAALLRPLSQQDVVHAVFEHALPALGAQAGSLAVLNADGQTVTIRRLVGRGELLWDARQHQLADAFPATTAIRENRALFLSRHDVLHDFPALGPLMSERTQAYAVLPLCFDARILGALLLSFDEPRAFEAPERVFAVDLAAHCALALDRARLTDEREAERQLFFRVLDQLPDMVTVAELPSGNTIFRNQAYLAAFGAADDPHQWPLSRTVRDGRPVEDQEIEMLCQDGQRRWVSYRANVVRDAQGRALFAVAAGADISGRRQVEQAYREAAEALQAQSELLALADEVIVMRAAGGAVTAWNSAAEQLYGYSPEEAIGQDLHTLLQTRFPVSRAATRAALERGGHWSGELEQRTKDGRALTVYCRKALRRDERGEVAAVVEVCWDISARKQAEAQVQAFSASLEARVSERTAQLEALNAELDAFAYSVSHDLRAPVRHILSFGDLLRRALDDAALARAGKFVDIIQQSAQRMNVLIDELLGFARAAQAPLQRVPVELGRLVDDVRAELAPDLSGRRVRWEVRPLPTVQGDPGWLRQVLVNLLGNALKYTRTRNEAVIEVWAERAGREVTLHVRDNGVGFDPRQADRLFGVFQRLHRAEDFEGTGVGLSNVKRIVQRHGGRVWAEGRPDQGAVFSFSLPDDPS